MSVNSSKSEEVTPPARTMHRWWLLVVLPLWVFGGFMAAQLLVVGLLWLVSQVGMTFANVDETILNTSLAAVIYVLTLVIVVGVPYWIKKIRTTKSQLGLQRLPSWLDIGLTPPAYVVYVIGLVAATAALTALIPDYNLEQAQEVGFEGLTFRYEYALAFLTLVIIAPIAEEILFRGYLYGKLRQAVPLWAAILATSALFAAVHGQWNVAVDTFILSVVMCGLREVTGSIWAGILLHMLKNGIAYYFLFVNPTLIQSIGM